MPDNSPVENPDTDDEEIIDLLEVVTLGKSAPQASEGSDTVDFSEHIDSMMEELAKHEGADVEAETEELEDQPFPDPTPVDHEVDPNEELPMPSMEDLDNLLESLGAAPEEEASTATKDAVSQGDDLDLKMPGEESIPVESPAEIVADIPAEPAPVESPAEIVADIPAEPAPVESPAEIVADIPAEPAPVESPAEIVADIPAEPAPVEFNGENAVPSEQEIPLDIDGLDLEKRETIAPAPAEAVADAPAEPVIEEAPAEAVADALAEPVIEETPAEAVADAPAEPVIEEAPAEAVADAPVEPVIEETPAEAVADAPVEPVIEETPADAVADAPAEPVIEEAPAEAVADAPAEPVIEETPAEAVADAPAEPVIEETPAEAVADAPVEPLIEETMADIPSESTPGEIQGTLSHQIGSENEEVDLNELDALIDDVLSIAPPSGDSVKKEAETTAHSSLREDVSSSDVANVLSGEVPNSLEGLQDVVTQLKALVISQADEIQKLKSILDENLDKKVAAAAAKVIREEILALLQPEE